MIFINKLYFAKEFGKIGFYSYRIILMHFIYIKYTNYDANNANY